MGKSFIYDSCFKMAVFLKTEQLNRLNSSYFKIEDVYEYFYRYKWRSEAPQYLHEAINEIYDLTSSELTDYLRLAAITTNQKLSFESIDGLF